jgi:hypothetical protein
LLSVSGSFSAFDRDSCMTYEGAADSASAVLFKGQGCGACVVLSHVIHSTASKQDLSRRY